MATTLIDSPVPSLAEASGNAERSRRLRPEGKPALALIGLVLLAFWPALQQGFVAWDDPVYLEDSAIQGTTVPLERLEHIFGSTLLSNYNPLHRVSNWAQCVVFGGDAGGLHLVSLLLHAANSVLVLVLARRLGANLAAAFVTAALFAVHPVRVENVAWWTSQKDLGSGLFALLALVVYAPILTRRSARPLVRHAVVWGLFLLAILFKSMLVTIPALLLVLDLAWRRPLLRSVVEKLPYLALSIVFSWLTVGAGPKVGPLGGTWDSHIAVALMAPWHYLARIFAPLDYAARYFVPRPGTIASVGPVLSIVALTLIGVAACRLCRSVKHRRWVLLTIAWPLVALSPVLNLVPITTVIADRFLYLALVGPFLVCGIGGVRAIEQLSTMWPRRRVVASATACLLVLLGTCVALSFTQTTAFADSETLWRRSLAYQPHNPLARLFLARLLIESNEPARAREALELLGAGDEGGDRLAQAILVTRYRALRVLGRRKEASVVLDEAVRVAEESSWKFVTAKAVADIHADREEWDAAHAALDRAEIDSTGAALQLSRTHADFALRAGDLEAYLRWSRHCLELEPFGVIAWHNREQLARRAGFEQEARNAARRVRAIAGE